MKFLISTIILVVAFAGAAAQPPAVTESKKTKTTKTTKTTPTKTTPANCGLPQICGQERWTVKTLTDADAHSVAMTPVDKKVSELYDSPAPAAGFNPDRRSQLEKQTFHVKAKLVGYKQELDPKKPLGKQGDHDFHIVIQDLQDATKTMVIEIPEPKCNGICASPVLAQVTQARKDFAAAFPATPPTIDFVVVQGNVEVEVTGVGFFDFAHRQTGLAKNCVELHPVLSVKFSGPGPFTAKVDKAHEPPKHPDSFFNCIPESKPSKGKTK
jgi:hypothetical protein